MQQKLDFIVGEFHFLGRAACRPQQAGQQAGSWKRTFLPYMAIWGVSLCK